MKLLIVTQKVNRNDSVLGFFHRWIEEFSKHCESVIVICLEKGEYNFPPHVQVVSLGKEKYVSRFKYILNFYTSIWKYRKDYDEVFVHMNPEYVVLAGWFWRLLRKKISLWYVHRQVNFMLHIAERFANFLFTASEKSFHLKSKKIIPVGHGIDTNYFRTDVNHHKNKKFTILSVGRIAKIKRIEDLIQSIHMIPEEIRQMIHVRLVGGIVSRDDENYRQELEKMIHESKLESVFEFIGSIPFSSIREQYMDADLSINLAPPGGIDKAVLESFACGVPTLFRNTAFVDLLGDKAHPYIFEDTTSLCEKIMYFYENKHTPINEIQELIVREYDISVLISKIVLKLKSSDI